MSDGEGRGRRLLRIIIRFYSFCGDLVCHVIIQTVNSFIYLLQLAGRVCVATLPPTVHHQAPTFFKLSVQLWVLLILSLRGNFFSFESIKPARVWKTLGGGKRNR